MENMTTKQKALIGGATIVVILTLGALWFWGAQTAKAPVTGENPDVNATTTDETSGGTSASTSYKPGGMPDEPDFVLPEGATAIDEYAFTLDGQVYLRSITTSKPLAVPNSDAKTFSTISPFQILPSVTVIAECGAAPMYRFYADRKAVYFYQIWRTPTFRSSTIEVVVGADKDTFEVGGVTTATNDGQLLKVSYEKTDANTCKLILTKVGFEAI